MTTSADRLAEALRPFARIAQKRLGGAETDTALAWIDGELDDLTFGDLRLAASALSAHDAAKAGEGETGWRTIESAPRDGTVILLWTASSSRRAPVTVAFWCDEEDALVDALWHRTRPANPTHWRPLSEPPQVTP